MDMRGRKKASQRDLGFIIKQLVGAFIQDQIPRLTLD